MKTFELRAWKLSDAEDIAKALNNKKILDNLRDGIPYPYTAADAKEFIEGVLSAPPDSQYMWAIAVDGRAVGSVGIFRQGNIHFRSAELGYYLAEPYWCRGVMSAAVKEACDTVFSTTDIARIFAEPFACNTASCRVLEKAGFAREGTLRKHAFKNGALLDMQLYALVRD